MTVYRNDNIPIIYPSSDGKPMAENTRQFEWIVKFKLGLEKTTEGQDNFVAGDLFWYPVEGQPSIRLAPDVMVALGRPKGHRSSYLQWREDFIAPQIVIEILSPGNRPPEMKNKLKFYENFGVEEYYIYDPDRNILSIYTRKGKDLIKKPSSLRKWQSPLLKIKLYWTKETLKIFHPNDEPFLSYMELVKLNRLAVLNLEEQLEKTVAAKQRADSAEQRADNAEQRAELLAKKLKELGFNPDAI